MRRRSLLAALTLTLLPVSPALAAAQAAAPAAPQSETALRWSVDAGTTGMLVEDHRVPLVTVYARFPAGSWSPWVDDNDADVAFSIQSRDPAGALRRRADRLAAPIALSVEPRWSTLSVTCLKEDLPAVLQLVRDVLANRDFDRDELARRRQGAELEWKASLKQPRFTALQAGARMLFAPEDPRRRNYEAPQPFTTDPAKLAAARDTLVWLPGRIVGFAGAVTPAEARAMAATLLPPPLAAAPAGRCVLPLRRPPRPAHRPWRRARRGAVDRALLAHGGPPPVRGELRAEPAAGRRPQPHPADHAASGLARRLHGAGAMAPGPLAFALNRRQRRDRPRRPGL